MLKALVGAVGLGATPTGLAKVGGPGTVLVDAAPTTGKTMSSLTHSLKCGYCLGTSWHPAWVGCLKANGPLPDWVPTPTKCTQCDGKGNITQHELIVQTLCSEESAKWHCENCGLTFVAAADFQMLQCRCHHRLKKVQNEP